MTGPYFADDSVTLWHGDCLDVMATLPGASVDAVVTDPPYGLGFMGREWDDLPPGEEWARECLRVLKPGGYLLAFGGSRTWHRLACAVEDAGFEVRDSIAWLYGSGFPKSLDVSKAIDKAAGATREVVGTKTGRGARPRNDMRGGQYGSAPVELIDTSAVTAPATDEAARFAGWGTALKPAFEPIVVGRKPLVGTVAGNVLAHGTGALNIDACRVTYQSDSDKASARPQGAATSRVGALAGKAQAWTTTESTTEQTEPSTTAETTGTSANSTEGSAPSAAGTVRTGFTPKQTDGRWPTNVVIGHAAACEQVGTTTERVGGGAKASGGFVGGYQRGDGFVGSDVTSPVWRCTEGCQVAELDRQSGVLTSGANPTRRGSDKFRDAYGDFQGQEECVAHRGADSGGASRFFPTFRYEAKAPTAERPRHGDVAHPTVKPLDLMRWLVRLVTPPGGTVLEPFAGSGTTAEACVIEGFRCIAIEREAAYLPLITARLSKPIQPDLFGGAA